MRHSPLARSTRALSAVVVAVAALLTACDERAEVPTTVSDTTTPATVDQIPPRMFRHLKDTSFVRSWDLDLGSPVERSWISPNVPDLVFFETKSDHAVVAVDTMSGATRWVTIPLPRGLNLPPYVSRTLLRDQAGNTYADDRLYLISEDTLYCFDIGSGQVIWRMLLPFAPSTGPLAIGTETDLRVFIGDSDGRVRVISQLPGGGAYETWQWNLHTDLSAQPAAFENLVYVGDHSGMMRCFELDRSQKWEFNGGGLVTGSAVARDRVLFFGNTDNIVYAINRLTGQTYGQFNLNGQITRTPFCFKAENKRLYVWVQHDDPHVAGVYALRTEPAIITFADNSPERPHPPMEVVKMGQEWHFPGASRLIGSTPQHLFMTFPGSDVLLAVRRDSGQLDWCWDLNEQRSGGDRVTSITEYQDPTDLNRSVYTADDRGKVIAYRWFGYVPTAEEAVADETPVAPPKAKPADAGAAAPAAGDAAAPAAAPAPAAGDAAAPAPAAGDKPAADAPAGK